MAHPLHGQARSRRESRKRAVRRLQWRALRDVVPGGHAVGRGHALVQVGCCAWLRLARRRTRVRYPETVRFARLLLT